MSSCTNLLVSFRHFERLLTYSHIKKSNIVIEYHSELIFIRTIEIINHNITDNQIGGEKLNTIFKPVLFSVRTPLIL